MQTLSLIIPADNQYLMSVRDYARSFLQKNKKDEREIAKNIVVLDELVANAIEHGSTKTGTVQIRIEANKESTTIKIEDFGGKKEKIKKSPMKNNLIRGRGLKIAEAWTKKMKVTKKKEGRKITAKI